ncbi:MAG: glycine-rich protein [Candidatus Omnitrophica bacterium]|nr:glycine-rich protein [Candidatus Omnitrophota bacterium]
MNRTNKFIRSLFFCSAVFYASVQTAYAVTDNYSYIGGQQSWTVPVTVSSITVDVQGAQGSDNLYAGGSVGAIGGNGGRVQATVAVTSGTTIYIYVGGRAGYNGGGPATGYVIAGGGASDIRIGGTTLTDRKVVAGGGGGSGAYYGLGLQGGAGGDTTGGTYTNSGGGGTQSAGGGGPTSGSWGQGATGTGDGTCGWGGSGGGGYYGGGSGYYNCYYSGSGGGGGGSSWTDSGIVSGVTHTQGYRAGDGLISITYSLSAPSAPTLSSPSNGATNVAISSSLSWSDSSGATSYNLQVATDSGFSNKIYDLTGIVPASYLVSLVINTTYYWRVSATNAAGTSSWTSAWSFTTSTVKIQFEGVKMEGVKVD